MSDVEIYRRKADELLRLAAQAADMAERSRLVGEAAHWHNRALEAHAGPAQDPGEYVVPFEADSRSDED